MPLSEFLRKAKGKFVSDQHRLCPTDIPPRVNDDLVELVWENGQIVIHGQSSRATRSPIVHNLQPDAVSTLDSEIENSSHLRIGKFDGETILRDVSPVVPTGELELLNQEDEMVPWLNFPFDDDNYCSELLPEISGVTADVMSLQHSFVSSDRCSFDKTLSSSLNDGNGVKDTSKTHMLLMYPLPQSHTSSPTFGSRFSNVLSNDNNINHLYTNFGSSSQCKNVVDDTTVNTGFLNNDSSSLNFPHFSRPATLSITKAPPHDGISVASSSGKERIERTEKVLASSCCSTIRPTTNEQFISLQKDFGFNGQAGMCSMAKQQVAVTPTASFPAERTANLSRISSTRNDKLLIENDVSNLTRGTRDSERTVEHAVASSSVGSDNYIDRFSSDKKHSSKRKIHEMEEPECHSNDMEIEHNIAKKATLSCTESKRSRAAKVHNLSERRRRDRINEKMRALQELIPNCNKADKASMLDEAIEYLKTLQLQIQIMSMGTGMCMPPMMFPPGIQHVHPAQLAHFPAMGMGMAMGYRAGMLDLHGGGTLGFPVFPIPPMQGPYFPPTISGNINFPRVPGSNFPIFGHSSQGHHESVARTPVIPIVQPQTNSSTDLSTSRTGNNNEGQNISPTLEMKETLADNSSLPVHSGESSSSRNCKSNQPNDDKEVLDQLIPLLEKNESAVAVSAEVCEETGRE